MSSSLAHRGPDGEGIWLGVSAEGGVQVGLAHRRLAIIDLRSGQQPLSNERGTVRVVFNGEIYNYRALRDELRQAGYRFRTESDTETLVHAYEHYGLGFLSQLRGAFAFALWDEEKSRLLLARDRFGEKPLFLAETGEVVVFASEIQALLRWPGLTARLNLEVLPQFLQYRYVPGPATLVHGIRKLPPGCAAIWEFGRLSQHRYYAPPDQFAQVGVVRDTGVTQAFAEQLDESVRLMMVSDVPFGAFLSGGVDSSSIVAVMSRHSAVPVRTYSVGFEEAGFSELAYAAEVARAFGTHHHELVLTQREVVDLLPKAAALRDAPLAEPADVALYMLAREARRSVKMVLTGEGSDEVLAGYPKHAFEAMTETLRRAVPRGIRSEFCKRVASVLPISSQRLRIALRALAEDEFERRMPIWFGALSVEEVGQLIGRRPATAINGAAFPFESDLANSALRRILYFDQTSWLPDNLLERGDRMTMAASLEARMPFLDYRLVEMAASLPDGERVRGMTGKRVLRAAMKGVLPESILARRKMGFRMPVRQWLGERLRPMIEDSLADPRSTIGPLLDRRAVQALLGEHMDGVRNHEKLLWMLLTLELWCRANKVYV